MEVVVFTLGLISSSSLKLLDILNSISLSSGVIVGILPGSPCMYLYPVVGKQTTKPPSPLVSITASLVLFLASLRFPAMELHL